VRDAKSRIVVVAVLLLNAVSLVLTFERTFWVITVLGVVVVALRLGRGRRAQTLFSIVAAGVIGVLSLAAISPTTYQTAEQRLLSIGQYQTDTSVRYRTVESGFVTAKIRQRPILGWGLADTIYWGQPWTRTPPSEQSYTHVGFLWLFWREGILGGGVLLLLLLLSVLWPGRVMGGTLVGALRTGCQSSLLGLLVADLTFPAFQGYQITFVMGFLVAYCALPVHPGASAHGVRQHLVARAHNRA
jgi:O-antigen ligase